MKRQTSPRVTAEVNVLSVDTANKDREKHLLTPDFFDARRFAVARFTSTRTVPGENKTAQVTGNLTIRDVTREVTFAVKCLGYGPDRAKGKRAGFHAETRISRQDFGVSYPGKMPDFTLPDAGGTKVSLADALAKGPCKPKEMTWWIPSMPGVRSWRA